MSDVFVNLNLLIVFCWLSFMVACLPLCLKLFVNSLSLKSVGILKVFSKMFLFLLLIAGEGRYHKLGIISVALWSRHGSTRLIYTTIVGSKHWMPVVLWTPAWKYPCLSSPRAYYLSFGSVHLVCLFWKIMVEDGVLEGTKKKKVWFYAKSSYSISKRLLQSF